MFKRLIGLALLALVTACHPGNVPDAQATVEAPPVYVDVRTAEEFAASHVRGALHIPYDAMEQRWRELEAYRDRRVVVYCRSGRRAGVALETLKARAFNRAENGGGLSDLEARGVAVISNGQSPGTEGNHE